VVAHYVGSSWKGYSCFLGCMSSLRCQKVRSFSATLYQLQRLCDRWRNAGFFFFFFFISSFLLQSQISDISVIIFVSVFTNRTEFSFFYPQIFISANTGDTGGHRTRISALLAVGPV